MRDRGISRQVRHAGQGRLRVRLRSFAASEDGAASAEFVVVVATAVALSLLVTAQVGLATGTIVLETGNEMTQASSASDTGMVGGCAVRVTGPGEGGKAIEDC